MSTALAPAPGNPWIRELIDLNTTGDPFQKLKACSVVTYSETTLQRLPWSGLHRRNEKGPSDLILGGEGERGGSWAVTVRGSRLPGIYERSVFRALEWIAIDGSIAQGTPFRNPLILHPRDVCERLCWRTTQPQFEAIEGAMRALCRVQIEQDSGKGGPPRRFGLLRSVIAGARRSAQSGAACPQFVVYFDKFFEESVNAGKVTPINWGLWVALRDPIARRLLEILEVEFGMHDAPEAVTLVAESIVQLLPVISPASRSERRVLLDQAHAALIRNAYLWKVEARPGDRFRYLPGPTVMAMRCHSERSRGIRAAW